MIMCDKLATSPGFTPLPLNRNRDRLQQPQKIIIKSKNIDYLSSVIESDVVEKI